MDSFQSVLFSATAFEFKKTDECYNQSEAFMKGFNLANSSWFDDPNLSYIPSKTPRHRWWLCGEARHPAEWRGRGDKPHADPKYPNGGLGKGNLTKETYI